MGMIVEGVSTTKAAKELSDSMNVSMPITETIYDVLYNGKDVRQACQELMTREGTFENEFTIE